MNVHSDTKIDGAGTLGGAGGGAGDEPPRPSAAHCARATGDYKVDGDLLEIEVVKDAGDWTAFGPVEELIASVSHILGELPAPQSPDYDVETGDASWQGRLLNGPCAATIMLSDDTKVRALNQQFRGIDKPTNVLSFPYTPIGPVDAESFDGAQATNLGDIILAVQTVAREAAEQQKPPAHHFQHLVLHGLLHLLGFDHQSEQDAREMETIETQLLGRLGIPDPYADPATSGTNRQPGTK